MKSYGNIGLADMAGCREAHESWGSTGLPVAAVQRLSREVRMSPYLPLWTLHLGIHSLTISFGTDNNLSQRSAGLGACEIEGNVFGKAKRFSLVRVFAWWSIRQRAVRQPEWKVCSLRQVSPSFYLGKGQPNAPWTFYWTCSFTSWVIFLCFSADVNLLCFLLVIPDASRVL